MRQIFPIFVFLLLLPFAARAQRSDTTAFRSSDVIAPSVFAASGLVVHYFAHDNLDVAVKDWAQDIRGGRKIVPVDDYIQYAPVVFDLGLGLLGAEAKNPFGRRLVEGSVAYLSALVLSWSGKQGFRTLRPSGEDSFSFPSGHSTVAFTGAELVRIEYGWGWGAGAYAVAASVGGMRILQNRHWLSDVLAGAGVGILSANIGKWLLDPACGMLGVSGDGASFSLRPSVDPVSGMLVPSLALNF